METQRQKKISSLIQKEIAELIGSDLRRGGVKNLIISVTRVRVSPDLSLCKVYLSIFPSDGSAQHLALIKDNAARKKSIAVDLVLALNWGSIVMTKSEASNTTPAR